MGCTLLVGLLAQAQESIAQTKPESHSQPNHASGQSHHRGPKKLVLINGEGASAALWKPDLTVLPLAIEHGGITLQPTGVDNYHAVIVERDWGQLSEVLIRYEYMRGKPSGHSTSELTAAEKTTFEIIPHPVPREHQHYRSDQLWSFILRFKGEPVPHIPVILETSNGTILYEKSDENGKFSLRIPDDFPGLREGARDRRSAEFSISAEIEDGGHRYQTLLSAEYRVNPHHWQSFGMGLAAVGGGFLIGGFIGRIRSTETGGRSR